MKLALARAVYLVPVGFAGSEHAGERLPFTDRTTFGFLRTPMPGLDGAEAIGVCTNEAALSRTAPSGSTILVMRAVDLYVLALQRADYPGVTSWARALTQFQNSAEMPERNTRVIAVRQPDLASGRLP